MQPICLTHVSLVPFILWQPPFLLCAIYLLTKLSLDSLPSCAFGCLHPCGGLLILSVISFLRQGLSVQSRNSLELTNLCLTLLSVEVTGMCATCLVVVFILCFFLTLPNIGYWCIFTGQGIILTCVYSVLFAHQSDSFTCHLTHCFIAFGTFRMLSSVCFRMYRKLSFTSDPHCCRLPKPISPAYHFCLVTSLSFPILSLC